MRKRIAVIIGASAMVSLGLAALRYAERPRVIEGTWLYMFEGSSFVERRFGGNKCEFYKEQSSWLNYSPKMIYPDYTYKRIWPSSGSYNSLTYGSYRQEAFEIKFKGRKRFSLFGTGHLSLWPSEYDVLEMLEARPIPDLNCNVQ